MKILAIDQATHCGWCCGKDLYGMWDISNRKDESSGMRLIRFKAKLREVIQSEDIKLVAYERVASQYKSSVILLSKMVGIIETMCEEMGIQYVAFSAKEIKVFATGKGGSKKAEMIAAAREKYGYLGDDDNEADAMHMYHLARSLYD
ncbi:crossover junction endodeoxyribonuclease RuvC [Dyadobacter sp. BHUBP1]|uniref:crossover junction endodeoxyribonuclease RuvC n=1 Tax=Dyadobacter sp. BHUBP1 TaxID=3424178 RepID=UPI003D32D6A1